MELKKCPFCGSDAWLRSSRRYGRYDEYTYFIWVECKSCKASSRKTSSKTDPEESDWNDIPCCNVSCAWNMRAG